MVSFPPEAYNDIKLLSDKQIKHLALCRLIDTELAEQCSHQTGCDYIPMEDNGVASASMSIVITQLARRILDAEI